MNNEEFRLISPQQSFGSMLREMEWRISIVLKACRDKWDAGGGGEARCWKLVVRNGMEGEELLELKSL